MTLVAKPFCLLQKCFPIHTILISSEWLVVDQLLSNVESFVHKLRKKRKKSQVLAKSLWIHFSPLCRNQLNFIFHSLVIIAEKKLGEAAIDYRTSTNGIRKLISICVVSFDCWAPLVSSEIQMRDVVLIECFLLFLFMLLRCFMCAPFSSVAPFIRACIQRFSRWPINFDSNLD